MYFGGPWWRPFLYFLNVLHICDNIIYIYMFNVSIYMYIYICIYMYIYIYVYII